MTGYCFAVCGETFLPQLSDGRAILQFHLMAGLPEFKPQPGYLHHLQPGLSTRLREDAVSEATSC